MLASSGNDRATGNDRSILSAAEQDGLIEQFGNAGQMRIAALQSITRSRHAVIISAPSSEWYSGERLQMAREILQDGVRRKLSVRVLYHRDDLPHWCTPEYLLSAGDRGIQVRVTDTRLQELAIVDSQVAFMRTQVSLSQEQCMAVWAPPVIKNIQSLLTAAWNAASEPMSYLRNLRSDFDEMDRQVIHALAFGHKDEVAARNLGLSLRTYRRRVAEIMCRLDANSRFQAGVHALRDGLLRPGDPDGEFSYRHSA
ncbi:response regulator transcription factor [Streptomyces sp. CB01881]|uniref:response regulator transcription factor n=1 Tax=Streptomyces sp. CB01881 TaxID=2078691 RepID=UPI000CDC93CB|nr:response regulator transcription factor [Streptomyces sp. CB01881]AUY48495.1 hypothetical protein C2142_05485 [Streptomyces sp. CB01881]TYC76982.1 DNA-binding response regulator [Streptomyces sp. CB01881]